MKNEAKFDNIKIYVQLSFDYLDFMLQFKLYENYNENQILNIYESMFQSGFDWSIKMHVLNAIQPTGFEFTQLISCLCQNGITKSILG